MRIIQSRPLNPFPDYSAIKDETVKTFCRDLGEILSKIHRNIFDDINSGQSLDVVDSLPTATIEYRGRLVLLKGSGTGTDKLYLGIDTGSTGYGFKEITL